MTAPGHHCDASLARALESAEAFSSRAFCLAAADLYPDKGIRAVDVGGGVAKFYGPSDPINSVKGVGLNGPVNADEWSAVELLFHESGSPVVVDLCPFADGSFTAMLSERGYTIAAFETVTFRSLLDPLPGSPAMQSEIELKVVSLSDGDAIAAWGRVVDVGFADGGEPMRFTVDIARVRAHMAAREGGSRPSMLLATVRGEPAGGAALSITDVGDLRIAHMSGAAVLPQFRKRGIQSALTSARLRIARDAGVQYAKLDVIAGSVSHRNAERAGFRVAYTRPQVVKPAPK